MRGHKSNPVVRGTFAFIRRARTSAPRLGLGSGRDAAVLGRYIIYTEWQGDKGGGRT